MLKCKGLLYGYTWTSQSYPTKGRFRSMEIVDYYTDIREPASHILLKDAFAPWKGWITIQIY
ncbi:MAG: hypothetical protein R3Y67_09220, partial [Eubacteriales bacterium]